MSDYAKTVRNAAEFLRAKIDFTPRVGLVLGSGWGKILSDMAGMTRVSYTDVPGMKASAVMGHAGEWLFGTMNGCPICVMSGRLHYYEGHDLKDVTMGVRIMKELGAQTMVVTNAAGAVNEHFHAGDIMLITDHINMTGANPLFGVNDDELGTRFPDMSYAYDRALIDLALDVARGHDLCVQKGVYCWMSGPSFETPAEIRMVRTLGGDAVGMSTVPEVIAARHGGMRVLGISCMTNMAAGVLDQPLTHKEVLETTLRIQQPLKAYLLDLVGRL